MTAQTLNIHLPPEERLSVWPWLIALVSGACLITVMAQKLQTIPMTLEQQGQNVVVAEGFENIVISADGRDLNLTGTVELGKSTVSLSEKLAAIDGVRLIKDKLIAIDPEATALQEKESFLQALSSIDTSAVAFEPGSDQFTAGSDEVLNQLASLVSQNPEYRLRIEGHTDNTGNEASNLRLSKDRADAVARYLVEQSVSLDQLISKGYGSTQPIESNDTTEGRARNRRIEISYVD